MRSERKPLIMIAIVLVVMMALSSWRGSGDLQTLPPGGDKRPELSHLAGWIDGRYVEPSDLEGKIVVIDCFTSFCAPCQVAAPELVRIYRRYHSQGVEFVGLTSETDEDIESIRKFCGQNQIEWPVAYGATFQWQELGVASVPTLLVYNSQGDAFWTSDLPGTLEQAIQAALEARQTTNDAG